MRATLDISGVLVKHIGSSAGISRDQLLAGMPQILRAHEVLRAQPQPALDWAAGARMGQDWQGRPVVVLGSSDAVDAATALAHAAGLPLHRIDSPDAAYLPEDAVLVVLSGPDWVQVLAESLAPAASSVIVCGALELPGSLPGGPPPSMLSLSPIAVALLAAAGVPCGLVIEQVREASRCCTLPGLLDNPAYLLAAAWLAGEQQGLTGLTFLVPASRMRCWGRWIAGAWSVLGTRAVGSAVVQQQRGVWAQAALIGDEAHRQRVLEGPADRLSVVVTVESPAADMSLGEQQTLWTLGHAMSREHLDQLMRAGRPAVRARLRSDDAASLAALGQILLHAAQTIGVTAAQGRSWRTTAEGTG